MTMNVDITAIEASLADWDAGRNSELVEHAPEDIRALINVVKAVKRIHAPEVVQVSTADESMIDLCWCCKEPHPCDTARALGVTEQ